MKLIDKDKVVAKIERLKSIYSDNENIHHVARYNLLVNILSFLNTLEVKEVDEQKERMSECPYRQVGCKMYEGKILECNGACGWVVDHLNLKELKEREDNLNLDLKQ